MAQGTTDGALKSAIDSRLEDSGTSTVASGLPSHSPVSVSALPAELEDWVAREEEQLFCEAMIKLAAGEKRKQIEAMAPLAYPRLFSVGDGGDNDDANRGAAASGAAGGLPSPPIMKRSKSEGSGRAGAKGTGPSGEPSIAAWATAMQCIARHSDGAILQKTGWKNKRCNAAERAAAAAMLRHAGLVPLAIQCFREYRSFCRSMNRGAAAAAAAVPPPPSAILQVFKSARRLRSWMRLVKQQCGDKKTIDKLSVGVQARAALLLEVTPCSAAQSRGGSSPEASRLSPSVERSVVAFVTSHGLDTAKLCLLVAREHAARAQVERQQQWKEEASLLACEAAAAAASCAAVRSQPVSSGNADDSPVDPEPNSVGMIPRRASVDAGLHSVQRAFNALCGAALPTRVPPSLGNASLAIAAANALSALASAIPRMATTGRGTDLTRFQAGGSRGGVNLPAVIQVQLQRTMLHLLASLSKDSSHGALSVVAMLLRGSLGSVTTPALYNASGIQGHFGSGNLGRSSSQSLE